MCGQWVNCTYMFMYLNVACVVTCHLCTHIFTESLDLFEVGIVV